jgi:hypothetical protein
MGSAQQNKLAPLLVTGVGPLIFPQAVMKIRKELCYEKIALADCPTLNRDAAARSRVAATGSISAI